MLYSAKQLYTFFVLALIILSPSQVLAENFIRLRQAPPAGYYNCFSGTIAGASTMSDRVVLDGKGRYTAEPPIIGDRREIEEGQYIFDSKTSEFAFISGFLKGWIGVWELQESGDNKYRVLHFPEKKGGRVSYRTSEFQKCIYPESQ